MLFDEKVLQGVLELVKEASLSRLKTLSGYEDITLLPVEDDPLVFAHWMSFILVSGKILRIVFKAHFMSDAAKFFAAKTYRTTKIDVSQSRAMDFFREFCNLTAGQLKVDLAHSEVRVGVSLPGLTRGFDEIYYPRPHPLIKNYWQLKCGEETIYCSAHVELFDKLDLKERVKTESSSDGDVEFL